MSVSNNNFDAILKVVATDLVREDAEYAQAIDTSNTVVSEKTLRKVRRRIKNYDKSAWWSELPLACRRAVAAVLVVCTMSFALCMSIDGVRAEIVNTVLEWHDKFVSVFYVAEEIPLERIEVYKEPSLQIAGSERTVLSQSNTEYSICRQDIDNLKIEVVDSSDSWRYDILLAYDNNIIMFDNLTDSMFSRDSEGVDTVICENVGVLYKREDSFIYEDSQSGQVKRCDLDGGNQTVLINEDVAYFYVTEEYIYYTVEDNREIGINEGEQTLNINVSPIMRVDRNGENKETIYTPDFNNDFFIIISDFIVEGRYIYTTYDRYEKNTDGKWVGDSSKTHSNYLRYDTETGETYYFNFD